MAIEILSIQEELARHNASLDREIDQNEFVLQRLDLIDQQNRIKRFVKNLGSYTADDVIIKSHLIPEEFPEKQTPEVLAEDKLKPDSRRWRDMAHKVATARQPGGVKMIMGIVAVPLVTVLLAGCNTFVNYMPGSGYKFHNEDPLFGGSSSLTGRGAAHWINSLNLPKTRNAFDPGKAEDREIFLQQRDQKRDEYNKAVAFYVNDTLKRNSQDYFIFDEANNDFRVKHFTGILGLRFGPFIIGGLTELKENPDMNRSMQEASKSS